MTSHLLFAGHHYYPRGGVQDLVARGTVEELKRYFQDNAKDIAEDNYIDNWGHIVNGQSMLIEWYGELRTGKEIAEWCVPPEQAA